MIVPKKPPFSLGISQLATFDSQIINPIKYPWSSMIHHDFSHVFHMKSTWNPHWIPWNPMKTTLKTHENPWFLGKTHQFALELGEAASHAAVPCRCSNFTQKHVDWTNQECRDFTDFTENVDFSGIAIKVQWVQCGSKIIDHKNWMVVDWKSTNVLGPLV